MKQGNINVMIGGAVQTVGRQSLNKPSTIRAALEAAGGFAFPTPQMRPADVITVRRQQGGSNVEVIRFSVSEVPPQWELFELKDEDLVVFQWHIESEKT